MKVIKAVVIQSVRLVMDKRWFECVAIRQQEFGAKGKDLKMEVKSGFLIVTHPGFSEDYYIPLSNVRQLEVEKSKK